ncbi:hypothetical protein Ddye_027925 [Dipteronia dyeriana]|uniref:Cytochrome P450 n=1 Tax=Dipteronia dyeriana TaxID=168575 RepID=A0AAD9TQ13_9ROSI|nr:hypothetical protein Ddye_027925 [Dipteronia dyeriana]
MGFPYIGESLEFINASRKGHPEKFLSDRVAKYSSQIFKTSILTQNTVFFCGPAAQKFLFSNEDKHVNIWFPSSIKKIFSSTAAHRSSTEVSKLARKLLHNYLKPEALIRYISTMDSIAQQHFESDWEGKQQVTVVPLAKSYSLQVSCQVLLSLEDPEPVARFADHLNAVTSGIVSFPADFPGTTFNKAIKAANELRKEFLALIKQRRIDLEQSKASPNQDLLSHMLVAETDHNHHPETEQHRYLNDFGVADTLVGFLVAGLDPPASLMTSIVGYLSELPDVYNQVLKEQMEISKLKKPGELLNWDDIQKMKYSWNVACEVMRLSPPSQGSFREAVNDFVFSGFSIPKGWKLYWSVHSTNKNPKYFPNPEKFDPTRFEGNGPAPYTFVPFGGGPKMCPGKEYARLMILVFLHNVIKRFKWEKLMPDEKIDLTPVPFPVKVFRFSFYLFSECPNPEKFDPTRFEGNGPAPYTFVPFGGGPKMCPGKEYARLMILVFLHNVIKRFKWEKLMPDEKIELTPVPFPVKGLPIHLIPHKP